MAEPFIKLYKKMLKWEWYDDTNTVRLFLHCLLRANWESGSWHGISYEPGQFITSLQTLSTETHLTVKQVRVALEHLKRTNEVADLRQGNYRIITIVKWYEYQSKGKPSDNVRADQGQTEGKLGATDKEYKDIKEYKELKNIKEKPTRHKYGQYQNVLLSDADMAKLKTEFPNDYQERIERVSEYCKSKGKSYSDYLATIRSWARKESNGRVERVPRADEEQRNREIDEHYKRVQAGEFDHDDDGLWDMP